MPKESLSPVPATSSPTPGRRARKNQQASAHLLECAWRLFEDQGYETVTMEAIARAADVARGTLYKYFPVKEAFIQHRFHADLQLRRSAARAVAFDIAGIAERFQYVFKIEAAYAESMRAYVGPYLYYRLSGLQREQDPIERASFEGLILDLLLQGQHDGEIVTDTSAGQMAEYLVFLRLATLMRWLSAPAAPLAPRYEEMIQLFLRGAYCRPVPPPSQTERAQ